jgi:hypothetical protein
MIERAHIAFFLFDSRHPSLNSGDYGSPCEQVLLEAIASQKELIFARVFRGDLDPLNYARAGGAPLFGDARTLAEELLSGTTSVINGIGRAWHTIDLTILMAALPHRGAIFCLALCPLPQSVAQSIDEQLRGFGPYIGAASFDFHDSGHEFQFLENLVECVLFDGRTLCFSRGSDDELDSFGLDPEPYFEVSIVD